MSDKITDMIDMDAIAHLADLVAQKDLGEITITDGSKTITVKGKKSLPPMPVGMPAVPAAAAPHRPQQHLLPRQSRRGMW